MLSAVWVAGSVRKYLGRPNKTCKISPVPARILTSHMHKGPEAPLTSRSATEVSYSTTHRWSEAPADGVVRLFIRRVL